MAENNQTVILRVQLDEGKTEAQLKQLVLDIEATRKAQAALTSERKAGTVSDEEFTRQSIKLNLELKASQGEFQAHTKNLAAFRNALKSATGSVDQLKSQSVLLTSQYNAMSQEERETTEAGQELTAQLLEVNEALKKAGTNVADTRRNVGNYTSSIRDAIKESGFLGGITAKVTEAQETFSKAQVIAKAAIGGNVTALGFLRLALLATGLGAIVIVLGSLVAFLTKSQTGIDLVSRKFAGLKAVVDLVIGAASEFGEKLVNALSSPKQTILDLIDVIQNNLLNRVKAIGVIFQAIADRDFRKLQDGVVQLTVGVADASSKLEQFGRAALAAAKSGEAIELESQRILRAERALNVERSQSRARIEELKKLSDDSTVSVARRTTAAMEAARIENGLLAAQLKLQDDKLANTIQASKLDKQQTNDELDAIAEIRKERADTQQESLTLQTELQNKINSLATEGAAAIEARRKALDEAMLKSIEADTAAGLSREAAAAKFLDDQLKADQLRIASDERIRTEQQTADQAAYSKGLSMLERNLDARRLVIETSYAKGEIDKKSYDAKLFVIDQGGFAARLMLAKIHNQDVSELEKAQTRFFNAENEKRTTKEREENQKRLAVATEFGTTLGGLVAESLTEAGQSFEKFTSKFLVLILDTLEKQLLAGQVGALINSLSTKGLFGLVEAAAITATMSAAFAVVKASISAGTSSKFAQGTVLDGPGHHAGGVQLFSRGGHHFGEAEGGEAIINKRSTALFLPLLSQINEAGGGHPLLTRTHMAVGGLTSANIVAGQLRGNVTVAPINYELLARAMQKTPLSVSVRDTKAANARDAYTQSEANT